MPSGHFDPNVMHEAESWSAGIKAYKEAKVKPFYEGHVPRPVYVTHYFKKREQVAVNPITQAYNNLDTEAFVRTLEADAVKKSLNQAYDKQVNYEQKFDIITQIPKTLIQNREQKGHIHEVPYVQKLKPPSLLGANRTDYHIISTLKYEDHHWAPPGKRPEREKTPERKPPQLTSVNKPRDFDILTNRFKQHHEARTQFEADEERKGVLSKYWKGRDFDPIKVKYYNDDKEAAYWKAQGNDVLSRRRDWVRSLPKSYQESTAHLYDITTHYPRDPDALAALSEKEQFAWNQKAQASIARDEDNYDTQMRLDDRDMQRKNNRASHQRYTDLVTRGFNIISNNDFDLVGYPPLPASKARVTLADFFKPNAQNDLRELAAGERVHDNEANGPDSGKWGMDRPESRGGGSAKARRPTTQHGPSDLMTVFDHHSTNRPPSHAYGDRLPPAKDAVRSPRLTSRSTRSPLTPTGSGQPSRAGGRADEGGDTAVKVWRSTRQEEGEARGASGGTQGVGGVSKSLAARSVRTGGFARNPAGAPAAQTSE